MTEPSGDAGSAGGGHFAALASPTRRSILAALADEGSPREALGLACDLGLHVTTVRFHLEQLAEAGLVSAEPAAEGKRGRPRLLYSATGTQDRDERARTELIDALAGSLARGQSDGGRGPSIAAGRRWADEIARERPEPSPGRDPLVGVLEDLGFEPTPADGGIDLRACPFRAAAKANPRVVCSLHAGLVDRIAEQNDPAGARSPELIPFVTPTLCRIAYH